MNTTIQIMSLVGACFTLLPFCMLQTDRWKVEDKGYLVCNTVGCMLLLVAALLLGNVGFFLLNTVWGAFTIYTVLKRAKKA